MTQPSGWYDDPQDPTQLRYWDGVVWSSHVAPIVSPTIEQSTIGMPYGVAPAGTRPQSPGSQGAQGPSISPGGYGSPQQGGGQQDGQWPPYGQVPGPYGQQPNWGSKLATTPDGVVLSGWWKRVLARIIDDIIVGIVSLPLVYAPLRRAFTIFGDWFQRTMDAAEAGSSTMPAQPTAELLGPLLQYSVTLLVVYMVYEVGFLTWTGATVGKMAAGISVRLRERPGPPPLVAVLKRTSVKEAGSIFALIPTVGSLGSLFSLLDSLWPLWDDKKQALHDKVGATNVVVGRQSKHKV